MQRGFELVWERILAHEGETFTQVRGGEFTYQVIANGLALSRTRQVLARSVVEAACRRLPVTGPGQLNDLRGPSYLYAILTDDRITGLGRRAYEREQAQSRLLIVEGLLDALASWPAVGATVWAAEDRRAARVALQTELGMPEMVANFVLDMQLGRTTQLARSALAEEAAHLRAIIADTTTPGHR